MIKQILFVSYLEISWSSDFFMRSIERQIDEIRLVRILSQDLVRSVAPGIRGKVEPTLRNVRLSVEKMIEVASKST